MKTPYIAYPLFSNFVQPPTSLSLPTSTSTAHSIVLFLWLSGWLQHIWCAILCNDFIDVCMSSLRTLMHVWWSKVSSLLSSDMWCGFCWYSWFDLSHTHTHPHTYKDTHHTQKPVDWHTHIKIYLQQLLCAHSSYLYYIEWIIHGYQKFHHGFSFQKLFTW